jgi:uncharacterized protein (DUF58 family)
MSVLKRSWVVILLWLATLFLALAMPAETSGGNNIFFHLNYLFGGLLLLSFLWARFSLLGLRASRQLHSSRSQVGRYAEEQFTVENTSSFPKLWLEIRDHSELPSHLVSRVVSSLSAHGQRSWVVKTPCFGWGRSRCIRAILSACSCCVASSTWLALLWSIRPHSTCRASCPLSVN